MDGQERADGPSGLDGAIWRVAAVAMLGSLLAQLDATLVNVSLSTLARELDVTLPVIQWVTSGYLLALTFVLPLNGWLVGRLGGRRVYLLCFALFTGASALCGTAWSSGSLIAFRLLQGLAGGLLAPLSQLMIKRVAGDQFTRIAGYVSLPVLLGPLLGPVMAGAVLAHASWRWLFLINLPIGVLGLVLAVLFLPADREEASPEPLDWPGLLLLSSGLALVLFGSGEFEQPSGLVAVGMGAVMFAMFIAVERRKGHRALIDLALFRDRRFSVAGVTQFLWNGTLFAGQMLLPLFLIQADGRSPTDVGWMLAPLGLGMMVVVPCLGMLTRRFGDRSVAAAGAILSCASTFTLALLFTARPSSGMLMAVLFLRGAGQGAVGLPTVSIAYAALDGRALRMGTTALNIVQRLGGPTLTTLCAIFVSTSLAAHVPGEGSPWTASFLLLAGLHALIVLTTLGLPERGSHGRVAASDPGTPSA